MRVRAMTAGALFSALAACSSFGVETSSGSDAGATDGGVVDASALDASTADSDAATLPPGCTGLPLEAFATNAAPASWTQEGSGTTLEIVDTPYLTGSKGFYVHAATTTSNDQSSPKTFVTPELAIAKHVRLEYDLAVQETDPYAEVGCQIELRGANPLLDHLGLFIAIKTHTSLIAGFDSTVAGQLTSDENASVAGFTPGAWQHVVMEATVNGGQVSAQVTLGSMTTPFNAVPSLAYEPKSVRFRCGVLYTRPGTAPQSVDIAIDNVVASSCAQP